MYMIRRTEGGSAQQWEGPMVDQLMVLTVGFLLTGVFGGVLGYFFQRRAWAHQHEVERRDEERQQAVKVFEEVSSLLDRRLYRMRRVYWAARRRVEGSESDQLAAALDDYRDVLMVWNDNLNRSLALVDTYFGHGLRRQLEIDVYGQYAAVGRALDEFVRKASGDDSAVEVPPLARRLNTLSYQVYQLNSRMLKLMQDQRLGRSAPVAATHPTSGLPVLQFGQSGPAVRRLQRALNRAGESPGLIDGAFGRDTHAALRAFQRSREIDADGIAGPSTWAALPSGAPMPVLREGAQGEPVMEVQVALTEYAEQRWELVPERADGVFGPDTTTAVAAFQRWHGLNADGIVGDQTWAAGLDSVSSTLESRVGLQYARQ
jgi:hypothetical protein